MALASKKYERMYSKTGSDADLISTAVFDEMKEDFDNNMYLQDVGQTKLLGPVLYQLQQIQDELDALRTEISSNKDNRIVIGSNTTISFGDMVFTTDPKSGKETTSIVMTVVYTDPSSSKVTTKTTTLSLT